MNSLIIYAFSIYFMVMKVRKDGWTGCEICNMQNAYKILFR
jgi:hypothetical protein